jgi:hypothetical protein
MLAQSTRWTRGVSQCGLAIYIKKYLGKGQIMEIQIFHRAKI